VATETQALKLEVATPKGMMLSVDAASVTAQSVNGEFGVLPGHLPLLVATRAGVLSYVIAGKREVAACGPGFAEAGPHKVLLLCETFQAADAIDVEAARKERDALDQKLKSFAGEYTSNEYAELLRDREWAQARIDAAATLAH
jgi:F-type H+-transporting ATPase subunit epsilon